VAPPSKNKKNLTFWEIFETAEKQKSEKDKIAVLHQHSNVTLKQLLDYAFHPGIKWLLPEGTPPFKDPTPEMDINLLVQALHQQHNFRQLRYFLNIGPYPKMDQRKREGIFIDFLGSIHPLDAKLICEIKDKKWPFKNLKRETIMKAFPGFTKHWEAKTK
jgi:hypothetical protein